MDGTGDSVLMGKWKTRHVKAKVKNARRVKPKN